MLAVMAGRAGPGLRSGHLEAIVRLMMAALALCGWMTAAASEPLRVTMVNPGSPEGEFWGLIDRYAVAAAEAHGVDLEVVFTEQNHHHMVRTVQEVVQRDEPPDVVLFANERLVGPAMIRIAHEAGVPSFVVSNVLTASQREALKRDGVRWLGELDPDHHEGGARLLDALVAEAESTGACQPDESGRWQLLALHGDRVTPAAVERRRGLQTALARQPRVVLAREIYAEWRREHGRHASEVLLQRYPEACLIWAANDGIALGAIEAAEALGRQPGKDLLVAGLNGSNDGLEAMRQGKLAVSVAGHFLSAGLALQLLADAHERGELDAMSGVYRRPVMGVIRHEDMSRFVEWRAAGWSVIGPGEAWHGAAPWAAEVAPAE